MKQTKIAADLAAVEKNLPSAKNIPEKKKVSTTEQLAMLKERKSGALTREEEFKKMFGEGGAGDATMR